MKQWFSWPVLDVVTATAIATLFIASQASANWAPELLVSDSAAYRDSDEAIIITLPQALPADIIERLALEIDDIDVSSFVELTGNQVIYKPVPALASGAHELRLIEYADDGSIVERGVWEFSVRAPSFAESSKVQLNATLEQSYRVAEKDQGSSQSDNQYYSAGGAKLNFQGGNSSLNMDASADLFFNEDRNNSPTDKQIDLGHYQVTTTVGEYAVVTVGNHSIDSAGLIYDRFYRRGVSAKFTIDNLATSLKIFNQRVDDTQGFDDFLGVNQDYGKLSGVSIDHIPISNDANQLTISTSYLDADIKSGSMDSTLNTERIVGDASSVAIDGLWLNKKFRSRFEYAQTNNKFNADNSDFGSISDTAYSTFLSYQAMTDNQLQWNISAELLDVSPNFYSVANDSLASDNLTYTIKNAFHYQSWSADLFYKNSRDNRDKQFDSTNTVDTYGLTIGFLGDENKYGKWLGTPEHFLSIQTLNNQLPESASNQEENFNISNMQLDNVFTYINGQWSLLLAYDEQKDKLNSQDNESTLSTEFAGFWQMNKDNSIDISLASYDTKLAQSNQGLQRKVMRIDIANQLFSERLINNLSFEYEDNVDDINVSTAEEISTLTSSLSLRYEWLIPSKRSPGVDISLQGNHLDIVKDTQGEAENNYDVYFGVMVFWGI